jgi:serine/threonine protein phosphatase PrpC
VLRVVEHFERSDAGRRRRGNEDAFYARAPLFAVADGMGGAQAGEVASGIAIEVLEQGLPDADGSVEERLARRVHEANERINTVARADEQRAGMGTTLTVAHVGEREVTVAHVGDSRMYRLRDGSFERLTEDHSLVEELRRQGRLTPAEAEEHPQRSIITRALGPEAEVQPDIHTWAARAGDVYLICSDGLTPTMVPEEDVGELLARAPSLADAGRALIDTANAAGGRDNITVVLFRLGEVDGAGAPALEQPTTEGRAVQPPPPDPDPVPDPMPAPAPPPAAAAQRLPLPPRAQPPRRRRRLRVPVGLVVALAIVAIAVLGGYYATQTVYFVGGTKDGFVAVYRGVPYDLPGGLALYTRNYESGVSVVSLPPRERRLVTNHKLRSHDDAASLVRAIELGNLEAAR